LQVDWNASERSSIGLGWNWFDRQYARGDENNRDANGPLGGYSVTYLQARFAPAPGWEVSVKVDNLFDRRYESFGVLGQNFFTGPANTFDAIAIAFGLRNLESPESGLAEMRRVLKRGGRLVVLEFSKPTNALFNRLFQNYFFNVLPRVGAALSRHHDAYTYLPESVSQFPDQTKLAALFSSCEFERIVYVNLTGGIAAIHWGEKK